MKDRIFNNWQTTFQGLLILIFSIGLLILKLATYTELSGLKVISLILIFSKNRWIKKFFNKIPFIILFFSLISCSTLKHKEVKKVTMFQGSIFSDSSKIVNIKYSSVLLDSFLKDIYIIKYDTIIKIDSFYFPVKYEKIFYTESGKISRKDTIYFEDKEKVIKNENFVLYKNESDVKDKKTFNYFFIIPILLLIAGSFIIVKKWL
jgi:hypothetical protein